MNVYVSLDTVSYNQKPDGKEIGKIKYRIIENWQLINVKKLADLVGNKGKAMISARLEGGISEKHCKAMQLFALDFDCGCRFQNIKRYCDQIGLPISFAYHTYSSTETEERFRIVFSYEILLEDPYVIKIIMAMLYKIFPECDAQCKNLDRMFWGGKELIYVDENARISLVQLLPPFYEKLGEQKNYKRNINSFCNKYKIAMQNGNPIIAALDRKFLFGDSLDSTIIHNIGESTKSPFFIAEGEKGLHQSKTCQKRLRKLNLEESFGCQLLVEFKKGMSSDHMAKLALITNLMHINGGKKLFFSVLERFDHESHEKWNRDYQYIKNYNPQKCSDSFCPYYATCENQGTIVDTLAMDRKITVEEEDYYSREESEECLKENLENAYSSPTQGLHLILAQTALGKTTTYINLMERYKNKKFIVALPTNILKKQVTSDLQCVAPNEVFMTPSAKGNALIPEYIQDEISRYHEAGIHNQTSKILKMYSEEIKDDPNLRAVREECEKIIKGLDAIKNERIIVTTHAYLMQMPESFLKEYTIIIDEDILQLQFFNNCHSVTIDGIEELLENGAPQYSAIVNQILNAEENVYYEIDGNPYGTEVMGNKIEEMQNKGLGNFWDLIYAKAFVKIADPDYGNTVVHYFCPPMLPAGKYIILSATLNTKIYEKYFVGIMPVFCYPEKKARYEGNLIQYTYHSLGRRDLLNKLQVFDFACNLAQNRELGFITFMRFANEENLRDKKILLLHFGNATGINSLQGQDLGIIGTPFKIEHAYKLVACYLGADVNNAEDIRPRLRRIKYKGKSFLITTYKDELLREIQLYSIESELEQCIGRARLLRKKCTVYVFSAFPCEQAELYQKNYL